MTCVALRPWGFVQRICHVCRNNSVAFSTGPGGGLTLTANFVPNVANADVSAFRKWDEGLSAKILIRRRRTDAITSVCSGHRHAMGLANLGQAYLSRSLGPAEN